MTVLDAGPREETVRGSYEFWHSQTNCSQLIFRKEKFLEAA